MLLVASLAAVALAGAPVVVEGGAECPAPAAVTTELGHILSLPASRRAPNPLPEDRAAVSVWDGTIRVTLTGGDGALIGERELRAEGTCEEQARAVAVILAAWLTDVHPEYRSILPPEERPSEPSPPAATGGATATAPAEPAGALRPSGARQYRFVEVHEYTLVRRTWGLSGSLGAGAEFSDAGAVPPFEISGRGFLGGGRFGATAFAILAWPAERELGMGRALSFRWPFGLGPSLQLPVAGERFELSAGPQLGWLHVDGEGYVHDGGDDALVFGGFFTARFVGGSGKLRPFVSATVLAWFGPTTLTASAPDDTLNLPPLEAFAALGLALGP